MSKKKLKIEDVFVSSGLPSYTYVNRSNGKFEEILSKGLRNCKVCIITGPSQTGKTTLYEEVLNKENKIPLLVNCDDSFDETEFWKQALEDVKFERIKEFNTSKKITASVGLKAKIELGWNWVAKAVGEVSLGLTGTYSENEVRERILSKPSPKHLIPILKELPFVLVIEDIHYLNLKTQKTVFQQWKKFHDSGVPIIIIGTTIQAIKIAKINKDLRGRTVHCDVSSWYFKDIQKIINQGFNALKVEIKPELLNWIAEESIGMPSITQEICLNLFDKKNIYEIDISNPIALDFKKTDIELCFHELARDNYGIVYNDNLVILQSGLNEQVQKYKSYRLLLLIFRLNPIQHSLNKVEVISRVKKAVERFKIDKLPTTNSILNSLKNLNKVQENIEINLLEWNERNKQLYILEPTFLFYLRWYSTDNRESSAFEYLLTFSIDEDIPLGIFGE